MLHHSKKLLYDIFGYHIGTANMINKNKEAFMEDKKDSKLFIFNSLK